MPQRVALIITDLDVGGAERNLVTLARGLPAVGFSPSVLVLASPPKRENLVKKLAEASISVEFLRATSAWQAWRVFTSLRRRLRELRPAIVQTFLHHANVVGTLSARSANVKHIVTGIRVAERRWNSHRLLARRTSRFVDRHVCVSDAVSEFAIHRMHLPRDRIVTIRNGIDVDGIASMPPISLERLGVAANRRMLVSVGRLERQKRLDWLIDRAPDLFDVLPNHDLVIVGTGPLAQQLRRRAEVLGVAGRVQFVGWRDDVAAVLAAADALLHTADWEGLPNVVLEAMAMGVPVVARPCEGVAELLGPLCEHQLVGADNPSQFVKQVCEVVSNRELHRVVGKANQRRAAEEFSIDQMVRQYAALYRQLIQ